MSDIDEMLEEIVTAAHNQASGWEFGTTSTYADQKRIDDAKNAVKAEIERLRATVSRLELIIELGERVVNDAAKT